MEDPVFKPKTCPLFSNASIRGARMPNMRHQAVASGWHWQKKWSKHMEVGFGSKANPRRERLYDLSYALRSQEKVRSQEKRHDSPLPRRCLLGFSLSIPCWMRGLVAGSSIFTALLCGGCGRGKGPPCVGEKTGAACHEMCRAQFLRPRLFYARLAGAL